MREVREWSQLDGWGQEMSQFVGTDDELKAYLRKGNEDVASFDDQPRATIYLPGRQRRIRCRMIVMRTPWGRYRFIPAVCCQPVAA